MLSNIFKCMKGFIMTIVAIWCRHKDDNIIGIGANIPWHISSDFKRFKEVTKEQNIVAGQTTYESFPNRTLPNRNIFVLTFDENYEVSNNEKHFVVTDIKKLKSFDGDLYIAGGASVYKCFMTLDEDLMPDIIVDSVFQGELNSELEGDIIDISASVSVMEKEYTKVTPDYELDNVLTSAWLKKGVAAEQEVLAKIMNIIKN